MTPEHHKRLEEMAAVATLVMFLAWLFYHLFRRPVQAAASSPDAPFYEPSAATPATAAPTITLPALPAPSSQAGDGCGCGCGSTSGSTGCPVSSTTINTVNQMIAMGNAAQAAMTAAANNTLAALAQIGSNPLLDIVIQPTQG